jgi:hypothetical protein
MAAKKIPQEPGKSPAVGYKKPPAKHQFKPGNKANPGGRPKGRSLTALLREWLDETGEPPDTGTNAERIVAALIRGAVGGDRQTIKDVFERVEGKVTLPEPETPPEAKPRLVIPDGDARPRRDDPG